MQLKFLYVTVLFMCCSHEKSGELRISMDFRKFYVCIVRLDHLLHGIYQLSFLLDAFTRRKIEDAAWHNKHNRNTSVDAGDFSREFVERQASVNRSKRDS